jgi:hypothetical protein
MTRELEYVDFLDILQRVKFRDWKFAVTCHARGEYSLHVRFADRTEAFPYDAAWQNGRKWRLSVHMTESEVVQTALKAVLTALEHEAREGFEYRGVAIYGPHLDVEKLREFVLATKPALREEG